MPALGTRYLLGYYCTSIVLKFKKMNCFVVRSTSGVLVHHRSRRFIYSSDFWAASRSSRSASMRAMVEHFQLYDGTFSLLFEQLDVTFSLSFDHLFLVIVFVNFMI